ncbi:MULTISPECIES: DUF4132 domain-containing protein [unclassified Streptomyces]|uniref:DUF4132 domain-containing protein n=1 Tax=unclassified Streptomyces TaxID=2593676 RepID=UPI00344B1460
MWSRGGRPYSGRHFPRSWNRGSGEPLRPRSLSRALVRASRKDERAWQRQPLKVRGDSLPPFDHCAALVAGLAEDERRRIALRLQQERAGLEADDVEWYIGRALAATRCGWSPGQVHELFALALGNVGNGPRPYGPWAHGERALQLPLAALEELPESERGPFLRYVRAALAVRTGCRSMVRPPGRPSRLDEPEACLSRLRALLDLPYDVDDVLVRDDPFATAARCALGTELYEPPAPELLELCGLVTDVRPPYAWLGRMRELLQCSPEARRTVRTLLRAVRGEPATCVGAELHRGRIGEVSGWLLVALAWAACVSDDAGLVRELGDGMLAIDRGPGGDGAALFLRGGLAALAALTRAPAAGRHHRLLADPPAAVVRTATEVRARLAHLPQPDGHRLLQVQAGPYVAVFRVHPDGHVTLGFRNPHGRMLEDAPAKVRNGDPALYAALRAQLTSLRAEVTAYRGLLAELLHADPGRPAGSWCEVHLDDPLFEPLTRALIWQAETPNGPVVGVPVRRKRSSAWVLRDLRGGFHELVETTTVRLWAPAHADAAEVAAWTSTVRRRGLRQPVPQVPRRP